MLYINCFFTMSLLRNTIIQILNTNTTRACEQFNAFVFGQLMYLGNAPQVDGDHTPTRDLANADK